MRSILYLCFDVKRCKTLAKAINGQAECSVVTARTVFDALAAIQSGCIDTIFIDLDSPVHKLNVLLQVATERFPSIYRIFIRGKEFDIQLKSILTRGHGSFPVPTSARELETIIEKLNRDYPIPPKKVKKPRITLEERVNAFLTTFSEIEPSQQHIVEQITHDEELSRILLSRINSPFYALPSRINNVDRAIRLLGVQGVFSLFDELRSHAKTQVA